MSQLVMSISSIINTNNQGPNFDPWGTPAGTFFHCDLQSCDNFTLCLRHFRKSTIKLTIYWGIFRSFSFRTNMIVIDQVEFNLYTAYTKQRKTFMPVFASICSYHFSKHNLQAHPINAVCTSLRSLCFWLLGLSYLEVKVLRFLVLTLKGQP
jgi:hypothetical protein